MKQKLYLLLYCTLILLSACESSRKDEHKEFHENGTLKFVVPLKDGKWNGEAREFYSSGKLRGRVFFEDNRKQGISFEFYESGQVKDESRYHRDKLIGMKLFSASGKLVEETFMDSSGNPIDFHRFKLDGTRNFAGPAPIVYTGPSIIREGEQIVLQVRLGNADTTKVDSGKLLIFSEIIGDTLFQQAGSNKKGFNYAFTAPKKGRHSIDGAMIFNGREFRFQYLFESL